MRASLVSLALALAATLAAPGAGPAPATAADGAVWLPTLQATRDFDHLTAFPNGVYYATYLDGYVRSRDHGVTWEPVVNGRGQFSYPHAVRFATPTVGFMVGGSPPASSLLASDPDLVEELRRCGGVQPLRRTTDGGRSWRAVCMPNTRLASDPYFGPGLSPLSLGAGGRTIVVAGDEGSRSRPAGDPCRAPRDVFYTSHDAGATWSRSVLPAGWFSGFRQYLLDPRTVARIVYGDWRADGSGGCWSHTSAVFLSRDGGRTFTRVLTCGGRKLCTSVAMPSRKRIVAGRNDGVTLVSDDGGKRWRRGQRLFDSRWQPVVDSKQLPEEAFWVQAMSFADARHGYASTRGSGTWRTTDGGISWSQERSHECVWYQWGIGEVAAGTTVEAITGGPTFISARQPVDDAPRGCGATQPEAPRLTATDLVHTAATRRGTVAVHLDGSLSLTP